MPNAVKEFYDQYAEQEWNRLQRDAYNRINFILHMDFIKHKLFYGAKVLDAGCGGGRYAVELAKLGCEVTLLDCSPVQLQIAKEKFQGFNLTAEEFIEGDIRDLSMLADASFDMVICYGAPLSYVLEGREKVMNAFKRVVKKGGTIAVSVNSRWGVFRDVLGRGTKDFFSDPEYWYIDKVIEAGDLPAHERVPHPPRHFFEAEELEALFAGIGADEITLASSPCLCCGAHKQAVDLCADKKAFKQILALERLLYTKPTMVDSGEFLLARGVIQ